MKTDLDNFYAITNHLMRLKDICRAEQKLLRVQTGDDEFLVFTIGTMIIENSMCGQCKFTFPALRFEGVLHERDDIDEKESKFEAHMSTYDFFSCQCEDNQYQWDSKQIHQMYFRFYTHGSYDSWHNVFIDCNNVELYSMQSQH
jgi:hypothetical protein